MARDQGVNIAAGDSFSALAYETFRKSWENSSFVQVCDLDPGNFRGARGFNYVGLPDDCFQDPTIDGSGTKPIITTEARRHEYAGADLLAMTGGDVTRRGGIRLVLLNQLDVETLGAPDSETQQLLRKLLVGLARVAQKEGVVLWLGETVEMGVCVGSENPDAVTKFTWSGTMLGVWRESTVITGDKMRPGQILIALKERGLRTNGFTDFRRGLAREFGPEWWRNPQAQRFIGMGAQPPTLYDTFFEKLNGWHEKDGRPIIPITAIAHITGGGIPGKLAKDLLFPRGLSAELDSLFQPSEIVRFCAGAAGLQGTAVYKKLNGGQGAIAVMDEAYEGPFMAWAAKYGLFSMKCGRIAASTGEPRLTIMSKFTNEWLEYGPSDV